MSKHLMFTNLLIYSWFSRGPSSSGAGSGVKYGQEKDSRVAACSGDYPN